jgi:hypothetical protein
MLYSEKLKAFLDRIKQKLVDSKLFEKFNLKQFSTIVDALVIKADIGARVVNFFKRLFGKKVVSGDTTEIPNDTTKKGGKVANFFKTIINTVFKSVLYVTMVLFLALVLYFMIILLPQVILLCAAIVAVSAILYAFEKTVNFLFAN